MRQNLLVLFAFFLGVVLCLPQALAKSVTVCWVPGKGGSPATHFTLTDFESIEVSGNSTELYSGPETEFTIFNVVEDAEHYLRVNACNGAGCSEWTNALVLLYNSNDIKTATDEGHPYEAAGGLSIDTDTGLISGNVNVSNPRDAYFSRYIGAVSSGQRIIFDFRAHFNNETEDAPLSLFVIDADTGLPISRERMEFVDNTYGMYRTNLITNKAVTNARIVVYAGHKAGDMQFQSFWAYKSTSGWNPLEVYLKSLEAVKPLEGGGTVGSVGTHFACFKWGKNPDEDFADIFEKYIIRIGKTSRDIEDFANGDCVVEYIADIDKTEFYVDITDEYLNGLYISVQVVDTEGRSGPATITSYLPGNCVGTPDDENPPLSFEIVADRADFMKARMGYLYQYDTEALVPGEPAHESERIDIDNNNKSGRDLDYSFYVKQYRAGARMQ